jgi:hypothetical protein
MTQMHPRLRYAYIAGLALGWGLWLAALVVRQ